jgi:hypothetical protein
MGLPLEMLCDSRVVQLAGRHEPTDKVAPAEDSDDTDWSTFVYEGPVFNLNGRVGETAADNGVTEPVVWGLRVVYIVRF